MRMNQNNQCILTEQDVVSAWLNGQDVSSAIFEDSKSIEKYNQWCNEQASDDTILIETEYTEEDYVKRCISSWNMPDEYKAIDVFELLVSRCTTEQQTVRVAEEFVEYESRGLIDVLRFLIYLTDICKKNNIVLGVGRGSSVSSYCLYLLGVHKVDSIKYDLDIKEFLK